MPISRKIALKSTNSEIVSIRMLSEILNTIRSIPAVKAMSTRRFLDRTINTKEIMK